MQLWLMFFELSRPMREKTGEHNKSNDKIKLMMIYIHEPYGENRYPGACGCSILNIQTAEMALSEASESNPGAWADHFRYAAGACKNIAAHCKDLSSEQTYFFRLLHDIGCYAGVSSERNLIDGYRCFSSAVCPEVRGWL